MVSDSKFVVSKKDLVTPQQLMIEKGDVGIIKSVGTGYTSIFFIRSWKEVELANQDFKRINVKQTGDEFSNKVCNVCHKLKPTSQFAKNQNGKNNRSVRRPSCKDCRLKMEGKNISTEDKKLWGVKKPKYQEFECPICRKRTIAGVTSKLVLEHNHLTGKVGGWICDSCNTGLGRFKDDIKLLQSAIEFLRKNY